MIDNAMLIADIPNVYRQIKRKFQQKLNFTRFLDAVQERCDIEFLYPYAYGMDLGHNDDAFRHCLAHLDFTIRFKRPHIITTDSRTVRYYDFGALMARDICAMRNEIDAVVFCTTRPEYLPLLELTRNFGLTVITFSTNISDAFNSLSHQIYFIDEDLLYETS